ncbi:hypothetical protein, partial [Lishizhenia sp.]|uniref:hypothetical protein n=1 Tax=Lishizhenia sp. TaxID=2497594 RepID=UPI00299F369F
ITLLLITVLSTSIIAQELLNNDQLIITQKSRKTDLYGYYIGKIGEFYYTYTKGSPVDKKSIKLSKHTLDGKKVAKVKVDGKVKGFYKRCEQSWDQTGDDGFGRELNRDSYKIINDKLYHFIPDEDKDAYTRRLWVERINLETLEASKPELLFETKTDIKNFNRSRYTEFSFQIEQDSQNDKLHLLIIYCYFREGGTTAFCKIDGDKFIKIEANFESKKKKKELYIPSNSLSINNDEFSFPVIEYNSDDEKVLQYYSFKSKSKKITQTTLFENLKFEKFEKLINGSQHFLFKDKEIRYHGFCRVTEDGESTVYYFSKTYNTQTKETTEYEVEVPGLTKETYMNKEEKSYLDKRFNYGDEEINSNPFNLTLCETLFDEKGNMYLIGEFSDPYKIRYSTDSRLVYYDLRGDYFIYKVNSDQSLNLISIYDLYNSTHYSGYRTPLITIHNNQIFFVGYNLETPTSISFGKKCIEIAACDLSTKQVELIHRVPNSEFSFQRIYDYNEFVNGKGSISISKMNKTKQLEVELK